MKFTTVLILVFAAMIWPGGELNASDCQRQCEREKQDCLDDNLGSVTCALTKENCLNDCGEGIIAETFEQEDPITRQTNEGLERLDEMERQARRDSSDAERRQQGTNRDTVRGRDTVDGVDPSGGETRRGRTDSSSSDDSNTTRTRGDHHRSRDDGADDSTRDQHQSSSGSDHCWDASECVEVVDMRGEVCFSDGGLEVTARNACNFPITMNICVQDADGSWVCGTDGGAWGGSEPGETDSTLRCESTGKYMLFATRLDTANELHCPRSDLHDYLEGGQSLGGGQGRSGTATDSGGHRQRDTTDQRSSSGQDSQNCDAYRKTECGGGRCRTYDACGNPID